MPAKDSIEKLCEDHPHLDPDSLRAKVKQLEQERMKADWPLDWIAGILLLIVVLGPWIVTIVDALRSILQAGLSLGDD